MILAIDTATEMLGVALHDGNRIVWESERYARLRHTVELALTVEEMLRGAGVPAAELDALAVALGPGSFTALRIGLAFAIGMAYVKKLPVVGIPTLDILAAAQPPMDCPLVAVLRAGRARVAAADYRFTDDGWRMQGEPRVFSWPQLAAQAAAKAWVCGEIDKAGFAALERRKDLRPAPAFLNMRRAGVLAELAEHRLRDREIPLPPLQPVYLNSVPAAAD
jgi:tRNA threonylcarbamoyladenosine biosynthesis protein TsaB